MKGLAAIRMLLRRMLGLRTAMEPTSIEEIISLNEEYILDLVREYQLYEAGINALGVEIASFAPYHPLTQRFKTAAGESPDKVTLRDTEDFHRSFYIEYQEEQFEIKASDPKTEELLMKYGKEVLGLTPEHIDEIRTEIIKPFLAEEFERNEN